MGGLSNATGMAREPKGPGGRSQEGVPHPGGAHWFGVLPKRVVRLSSEQLFNGHHRNDGRDRYGSSHHEEQDADRHRQSRTAGTGAADAGGGAVLVIALNGEAGPDALPSA